jgi:hypothetical protein
MHVCAPAGCHEPQSGEIQISIKNQTQNQKTPKSMKRLSLIVTTLALAVAAQAQYPILVDDFSGDLSAWTFTRILNNGNHTPVNTAAFGINGSGALQFETTAYTGIEQYALTRTDFSLGVGEELSADFTAAYTGTQDIGLYVGAGTPTQDVRANYVSIYMRNNGQLYSRGFNGTTEFALAAGGTPSVAELFVARTSPNVFNLGYYTTTGYRQVLATRTITSGAPVGSSIGFYVDARAAGIVGSLDNLTIPEPTTAALLGLGLLGMVLNNRRRN